MNVAGKAQQSLLLEDEFKILLDCGFGTMIRLAQAGVGVTDIDAIVLTHFHLDHCGELMGILKARWLLGGECIEIFAPKGARNFIESLLHASHYLRGKVSFRLHEVSDGEKFSINGMEFEARAVKHSIYGLAYAHGDVLFSGDTSAFRELYRDVDTVIHELSLDFGSKADFHTSPENFVESADVSSAYFIHMYPPAFENRKRIEEFMKENGINASFPDDLEKVRV